MSDTEDAKEEAAAATAAAPAAGPQQPAPVEETGMALAEPETPAADPAEALRRERDDLRDQLLRRRAEFENYRKRMERERQAWTVEAEAAVIRELIPTLDHLEHALKAEATTASAIREGVVLIERDLLSTLTRLGLVVHDPTGKPFDPLTDQALVQVDAPGVEEGVVVETLRRGFLYKERLLRPALVKVAKGPASEGAGGDATSPPPPDEVH